MDVELPAICDGSVGRDHHQSEWVQGLVARRGAMARFPPTASISAYEEIPGHHFHTTFNCRDRLFPMLPRLRESRWHMDVAFDDADTVELQLKNAVTFSSSPSPPRNHDTTPRPESEDSGRAEVASPSGRSYVHYDSPDIDSGEFHDCADDSFPRDSYGDTHQGIELDANGPPLNGEGPTFDVGVFEADEEADGVLVPGGRKGGEEEGAAVGDLLQSVEVRESINEI